MVQVFSKNVELHVYQGFASIDIPYGAGSTVPREGFDSSVIMTFFWCVLAVTLPI